MVKKRTKIVATVSDLKCDVDFIRGLFDRGVNVIRLNTAHQTPEDTLRVIANIRAVSEELAILVDTKGPEMRTNPKQDEDVLIKTGDQVMVRCDGPDAVSTKEAIQVNYTGFVRDVPVGTHILIDDGYMELVVVAKTGDQLECRALNNGVIKKKKSVNVPGVPINLPSVTAKDHAFIKMSVEAGVDFIAHSFVRNRQDVLDVRKILNELGSDIRIVAKIENREGVENLDEVLEVADGVMVARGDLGIEVPAQEVPLIQKEMIRKCRLAAKPVITATQMLESMIKQPRATRAEVSDVANAILDGTDAIMLSGETAYGDYPFEAVETMSRIAVHIEAQLDSAPALGHTPDRTDLQGYVVKSAAQAAYDLNVDCILAPTKTGTTARQISAWRPRVPVFAACYVPSALRSLALSYAVIPFFVEAGSRKEILPKALELLQERDLVRPEHLAAVIMTAPGAPEGDSNQLEINLISSMVENNRN
jgi:pyruvate kinase